MMKEEEQIKMLLGSRKNPFSVPEGYFDQLAGNIIGQLPQEQPKPARIRMLRPLLYAAASVCLAIMGVAIYQFNASTAQPALALQETHYTDSYIEDVADYAMLDNEDIYNSLLADI